MPTSCTFRFLGPTDVRIDEESIRARQVPEYSGSRCAHMELGSRANKSNWGWSGPSSCQVCHRKRLLLRFVGDGLSLRWFLGYDLTASLPDRSTTPVCPALTITEALDRPKLLDCIVG